MDPRMKPRKWDHSLDQWLEDRVWSRVPDSLASRHFFWFFGFICGTLFSALILAILR